MNAIHPATALRHGLLVSAAILFFQSKSFGQSNGNTESIANINRHLQYNSDSVQVMADPAFTKAPTERWLLGDHYRREWITPVKVPVVDLDTLYGGFEVKKEGGGKQTKSLQLKSKTTGKEYTIRTVEKFPERALPPEFAGTIAAEFLKDQISSAHPYAPLIVAHLAKAAGVYHSNPQFVFVKSSKALAEYDSAFGNQLYLMEERPQGNWEGSALFGNAGKIFSTDKMREALFKPGYKTNSRAFLRARLLDILIGDWDRHEDQWTWAVVKQEEWNYIYPIAKDRDQAFARLDGVIPWIGTRKWALRRAKYFKEEVDDLRGLMWSGRNLDRLILVDLTWPEWEKEAAALQGVWTDTVIAQAVSQLPASVLPLSGKEIQQKLVQRRNDLMKYARAYYKILAEEVEWVGTATADKFVISAPQSTSVAIKQYTTGEGTDLLARERVFNTNETKEIRLYGLQGNDQFQIDSGTAIPVKIRLIGEDGQDQYINTAGARVSKVTVYDTSVADNRATRKEFKLITRADSLSQQYSYGDHHYNVLRPILLPGYNPDDGVYLGAGIVYTRYKWNQPDVATQHRLGANYAFQTGAYNFLYEGFFAQTVGRWNGLVNFYLNQPDYVLFFYGLGNNTGRVKGDRSYNRVRIAQVIAEAGLQRTWGTRHSASVLGNFLSSEVESSDKRFVSVGNQALDSSDFRRVNWWGGTLAYTFSTRDNTFFPTKGVALETGVRYRYSPTRSDDYANFAGAFSWYVPLGKIIWASRIGGATLTGNPQFFQYNQLSGITNLRGYRRSRFSGESMVYNNNELRIPFANLNGYILRGKLGVTLFSDNGRVWVDGEESDRWHVGYGGGLWIVPYQRISFTANFGISNEDKVLYVRAGFLF